MKLEASLSEPIVAIGQTLQREIFLDSFVKIMLQQDS